MAVLDPSVRAPAATSNVPPSGAGGAGGFPGTSLEPTALERLRTEPTSYERLAREGNGRGSPSPALAGATSAPVLLALQPSVTPAEIEAARQTFERLVGAGPGALSGTAAGGNALARALGVLGKGIGVALSAAGLWNAMAGPAGLPVLQETLMTNGPEAFFDALESGLQEKGGDLQAARALRTTVMGYLEHGDAHSAAVVLREGLSQLQQAGLVQRDANVTDLAVDAVVGHYRDHPRRVATPEPRPEPAPPPPLPTPGAPAAPPALSAELETFRGEIARGDYANGAEAYSRGVTTYEALIGQVNAARADGVPTVADAPLAAARVELDARRQHSVLAQYERNAATGGALPSAADLHDWFDDVWTFDGRVLADYGRAVFGGEYLNASEARLVGAAAFRERFAAFSNEVGAGGFANGADAYADGLERLETFRLEAGELATTLGVQGLSQRGYDSALLQLEGRRVNSVLAESVREANAGRDVDPEALDALVDRADAIDRRALELLGAPLFESGSIAAYRDVATALRGDPVRAPDPASTSGPAPGPENEPEPGPPSLPPIEPPPDAPFSSPGTDVARVAERYGVAPADVIGVMQQNPGMSPEQAAQYLRGTLLAGETGLNQPGRAALPPAPPDDADGTVAGSGETPDENAADVVRGLDGADRPRLEETLSPGGAITQLSLEDLEFRTSTDEDGTTVLFFEFTGAAADVDRAKWEASGYRVHDHRDERGRWMTYFTDPTTGDVLAYAPNTRLANGFDRAWALVQHNAGQIRDPAKRESYMKKMRSAFKVMLDPLDADRKPPGVSYKDMQRRLLETERAEWERQVGGGAGEERPGVQPEDRIPLWER